MLNKLMSIEAWRSSTDASMSTLLSQSDAVVTRLHHLVTAPPPPLPPPPAALRASTAPPPTALRPSTAPPQPSSRWTNPFDLNVAPQQEMRPSASSSERPSGHRNDHSYRDDGGRILGSRPPRPIMGTSHEPHSDRSDYTHAPPSNFVKPNPLPKLDFPKFDGENPRLWRDKCEMYFEVYGVGDSLKTRFAALNFSGAAASWLHSVECQGWAHEWDKLCSLVCDRFDREAVRLPSPNRFSG
ncbi:hypothetical protein GQ55_5G386400 [Panicum hallii var. hallii]|uniref:Retrotransposon gag domain-containing protein n=1 Tax=Panicum hallii var. hallii TaxID=1504633 RepID=A0A2T7DMX8_9POAL|nr:hypothetical protein GQ55_5G386400 [Panicum hallii var. hallii]